MNKCEEISSKIQDMLTLRLSVSLIRNNIPLRLPSVLAFLISSYPAILDLLTDVFLSRLTSQTPLPPSPSFFPLLNHSYAALTLSHLQMLLLLTLLSLQTNTST